MQRKKNVNFPKKKKEANSGLRNKKKEWRFLPEGGMPHKKTAHFFQRKKTKKKRGGKKEKPGL